MRYLVECQNLKRPPPNLRFRGASLLPEETTRPLIIEAERKALEEAIKSYKSSIKELDQQLTDLSDVDRSLQHPVDKKLMDVFEKKLKKRLSHYERVEEETFQDWPSSQQRSSQETTRSQNSSAKTQRNRRKRDSYLLRSIAKTAGSVRTSGKVVNLTDVSISDEAITVLSYGHGFVPAKLDFDELELRKQLQSAMVKVNNLAVRLEKPLKDTEHEATQKEVAGPEKVPPKLKRHEAMFRSTTCKDKVVSQLYDEVKAFGEQFRPTERTKFNLNRFERKGLYELRMLVKEEKIVVCKADKGGMIVILPPDQVRTMVKKHLEGSTNYECIGQADPLANGGSVARRYFDGWREAFRCGFMRTDHLKTVIGLNVHEDGSMNRSTLDIYKAGTPYFYVLPKVHKFKDLSLLVPGVEMPSRLVTALNQGLTVNGDKYITTNYLGPLALEFCRDRMKDTTQFLQEIEKYAGRRDCHTSFTVAVDVVSLYDNLSRSLLNESLRHAMEELRPGWTPDFKSWLLKMVNNSLDSVYAKFGDSWFKMLDCVPTGHTLSVNLADIAVYYAFNMLVYSKEEAMSFIDFVARFVDDMTMVWVGSEEKFVEWLTAFRLLLKERFGLEITFEITSSVNFSVFLDVQYRFVEDRLVTTIYHKPTDAHSYLNFSSSHPRHVFKSIVYSQALRYRRVINDETLLHTEMGKLSGYFVACDYPKLLVQRTIDDVISKTRSLEYKKRVDEKSFHVPFKFRYGSGASELQSHINGRIDSSLREAPVFSAMEVPVLKTVFTRGATLSSLLFKQKSVNLGSGEGNKSKGRATSRCTTEEEARHRKGRKCSLCPMISNNSSVSVRGKVVHCDGGDCKSRNVVYLFLCKVCGLGYVGKTDQLLRKRVNGHRNCGSLDEGIADPQALQNHAQRTHQQDFQDIYSVSILKQVGDPGRLLQEELSFIQRLNTLEPFGLNVDTPLGVRGARLKLQ